jgi:hypothetical protein
MLEISIYVNIKENKLFKLQEDYKNKAVLYSTHNLAIPALRTAEETALIAVRSALRRVVNSPLASG